MCCACVGTLKEMERPAELDNNNTTTNNNNNSSSSSLIGGGLRQQWPTIDGPLGLSENDSLWYARYFFIFGFFLLPLLWAVNCYLFWPVLIHSRSFPNLRPCKYFLYYCVCIHALCCFFID